MPDYVFPGIRRVGSLAAITIDLKKWDRAVDLLDEIGNLQKQEGDFLQRLWQMYSSFRTTIAVFIIDREASRRRFMGIQERYAEILS